MMALVSALRSLFLCYLVPFRFRNEVLQTALKAFHKGNELVQRGDFKAATSHFQQGIIMGRPVVLQLQQKLEEQQQQQSQKPSSSYSLKNRPWKQQLPSITEDDNPYLALEWLAQSYVASSQAHIRLGDLDAARRDAWGACLLTSHNKAALQCMLHICQSTDDAIGELSTLKMLRSAVYMHQQDYLESNVHVDMLLSEQEDDEVLDETERELLHLQTRISQLQYELDEKYQKRKNN